MHPTSVAQQSHQDAFAAMVGAMLSANVPAQLESHDGDQAEA